AKNATHRVSFLVTAIARAIKSVSGFQGWAPERPGNPPGQNFLPAGSAIQAGHWPAVPGLLQSCHTSCLAVADLYRPSRTRGKQRAADDGFSESACHQALTSAQLLPV